MAIKIGITSGKGGTGKSTVSFGLAVAFSDMGKRVLIIDLDEGLRCIDLLFGIESDIVYDLGDLMNGSEFSEGVYKCPAFRSVSIIPAPLNTGVLNADKLKNVIDTADGQFDVVILDFPAGADTLLYGAAGGDTTFIAVSNLDPVSVRDASVVARKLPATRHQPRLIINRFNYEYIKDRVYKNVDDIINTSSLRLLGLVAGSMELATLSVTHKLPKKSKPYKSFTRIAKRICGEDIKLPNVKKI